MPDSGILTLIGRLSDSGLRAGAARKLACALGAENLLIFSRDPLLGVLLPAPGWPQTLPGGQRWREFLENCASQGSCATELISPFSHAVVSVQGITAADGSVLALLGGRPDPLRVGEITGLVPLIAAAFQGERIAVVARGELEAESLAAEKSRALAAALDANRRELEAALAERDRSLQTLATINEVGRRLAAELDLEKLVQQVTDAATRLSGAQFGAFFYNTVGEGGQNYLLYTISGVPKEAFSRFPQPRPTQVFHPTFMGEGTVRSDDITRDPRYGKNDPHRGMPEGHLPVRSYLAVSVISRSGEVLGGLFFGHEEPGVFTERAERIVEGLASQAAVAMDNARLYRNLQESVRARDEFLSIASHELKTPLTSMRLQTQIRARNLENRNLEAFSEDRLRKMVAGDKRQVERLSRLVDDMLDIARISSGKLTFHLERFDLCALVRDVVDRHELQLEMSGCPVELECGGPAEGNWDPFRIEQVLTNLLNNAMSYGAGKPVKVTVERVANSAVLRVTDSGIGIAPENQTRVFERFERAISSRNISGLGLGLYISRHIVEMHGGSIQVESELGTGSTFTVTLPLA